MIVDTRDLSLAPHILLDGYWEQWITNVFLSLIKPGMNVLDIGANVGFYSLLAAEKIGAQGSLTCFEANPDMSDIVFQNLQINGFGSPSHVDDKAVYSENIRLTFNIYEKFLGSSSLWADLEHVVANRDSIKKLTVEGVTLDSFFPAGTRIDFIKIDAEGAEPFILKGAKRVLQDNPDVIIIMEFSPPIIANAYESVEIFYNELRLIGFRIFRIEHDSSISEMSLADAISTHHCDVVMQRIPG
jgi:FkbM family methyltransferase